MPAPSTMRTNVLRTTIGTTFFAVLAAAVAVPSGSVAAKPSVASTSASEAKGAATKNVALVKLEIRQESGKVLKNEGLVDWDSSANLEIKADDMVHALNLKVVRGTGGGTASVTLAYSRGDEAVIAPYTFDVKLKKREVIRIEGGLAIAVTVVPKKIAVEPEEEQPKSPKVETIDGDDPLSGL